MFKVAIIGAGHIAGIVAESIKKISDMQCVAIASRDPEKAAKFAENHVVPHSYGSYEEMIVKEPFDLAYVATINTTHAEIALQCIRNHKAAFVEKPFALNAEEAQKVIEAAERERVFVAEAMPIRYMDTADYVKRIIKEGKIGNVEQIVADLGFDMPDVERIANPELGGGALYDIGVYGLHIADMIYGEMPEKISSQMVMNERGVDKKNTVLFQYTGEGEAILRCDVTRGNKHAVSVYGREGKIEIDDGTTFNRIMVFRHGRPIGLKFAGKNRYCQELIKCRELVQNNDDKKMNLNYEVIIKIAIQQDKIREVWNQE